MKRLALLLPIVALFLMGQHTPHWETSVPLPVVSTDTPTTGDVEFKSNNAIEIHLDENDNDCTNPSTCHLYFYDGANAEIARLDEATGDFTIIGTMYAEDGAVIGDGVTLTDGDILRFDPDTSGWETCDADEFFIYGNNTLNSEKLTFCINGTEWSMGRGTIGTSTFRGTSAANAFLMWNRFLIISAGEGDGDDRPLDGAGWSVDGGTPGDVYGRYQRDDAVGGDHDEFFFEHAIHGDFEPFFWRLDADVLIDGPTLRLDWDNTGAVATGVGIELAPNTSGTTITMKTTTGPDLDWVGATEYNYDAKVNHPATRKTHFRGSEISILSTDPSCSEIHPQLVFGTGGPVVEESHQCGLAGTPGTNGYLYGSHHMPDDWDTSGGGDVVMKVMMTDDGGTPSGTVNMVVNAQCVDLDSASGPSTSWTTAQTLSATFATQYDIEVATASALDPDGACSGGDMLFWRTVICDIDGSPGDSCSGTSSHATGTVHFFHITMEYPTTGAE